MSHRSHGQALKLIGLLEVLPTEDSFALSIGCVLNRNVFTLAFCKHSQSLASKAYKDRRTFSHSHLFLIVTSGPLDAFLIPE